MAYLKELAEATSLIQQAANLYKVNQLQKAAQLNQLALSKLNRVRQVCIKEGKVDLIQKIDYLAQRAINFQNQMIERPALDDWLSYFFSANELITQANTAYNAHDFQVCKDCCTLARAKLEIAKKGAQKEQNKEVLENIENIFTTLNQLQAKCK